MGNIPDALQAYQLAYLHNPTKIKVIVNLARNYEKAGKYDEALATIKMGLKILPGDKKLIMQKCDILFGMGAYGKAIRTYQHIPGWKSDSLIVQNLRYLKQLIKEKKRSPGKN
jgi:tetratricopeptide (TPR) repeat protein